VLMRGCAVIIDHASVVPQLTARYPADCQCCCHTPFPGGAVAFLVSRVNTVNGRVYR
jgi:hypothetical protein